MMFVPRMPVLLNISFTVNYRMFIFLPALRIKLAKLQQLETQQSVARHLQLVLYLDSSTRAEILFDHRL